MRTLLQKVLGNPNDKALKSLAPIVNEINALEEEYRTLTDDELRDVSDRFREELAAGESIVRKERTPLIESRVCRFVPAIERRFDENRDLLGHGRLRKGRRRWQSAVRREARDPGRDSRSGGSLLRRGSRSIHGATKAARAGSTT